MLQLEFGIFISSIFYSKICECLQIYFKWRFFLYRVQSNGARLKDRLVGRNLCIYSTNFLQSSAFAPQEYPWQTEDESIHAFPTMLSAYLLSRLLHPAFSVSSLKVSGGELEKIKCMFNFTIFNKF